MLPIKETPFNISLISKLMTSWIFLLFIGFIIFYTYHIDITGDMIWYMNSALNIFRGDGYINMEGSLILNRGPVFPLMIAASFWVLEVSPWSAFWIIRLFCIFNPIIIYLVGKHFFGKGVGFAAAILVLTSYSLSYWSYRHLDAVWPCFILLSNYFYTIGFEKKRIQYFLLAGLLTAISILIKEVSILFVPLPILMSLWIKEYRKRYFFKFVLAGLLATLLSLTPWILYLIQHDGFTLFIGKAGPLVVHEIFNPTQGYALDHSFSQIEKIVETLKQFGSGLLEYYYGGRNSLQQHFILAPAMLLGWIVIFKNAFCGDKYAKILIINLILFMPILYFLGKNQWRLGQGIFFFLLSYLSVSVLINTIANKINSFFFRSEKSSIASFFLLIVMLAAIQISFEYRNDLGFKEFISKSFLYKKISGNYTNRKIDRHFDDKKFNLILKEIDNVSENNEGILVDWYYPARIAYFKLNGSRPVYTMPYLWCSKEGVTIGTKPKGNIESPLYITSNVIPYEPKFMLFMLFESQVIEKINKSNIKYVLITPGNHMLNQYFSKSYAFKEIFSLKANPLLKGSYRLYRVLNHEKKKKPFRPIVTKRFLKQTEKLKKYDRLKYDFFMNSFIHDLTPLTSDYFRDLSKTK